MSDFLEFGFGQDDENIGGRIPKFKMRDGATARISFAWWPEKNGEPDFDAPTPKFIGAQSHYIDGVGRVLHNGPEFAEIAGASPKFRIITIIVRWPTNDSGAVDGSRLKNGEWVVELWDFTKHKYTDLKPIHEEWGFAQHDLKCTCKDAGFQAMTFTACKESLLMTLKEKSPGMFADIMQQVKDLAADAPKELGKSMSAKELRNRIAQAQGGGGPSMGHSTSRPSAAASVVDSNIIDGFIDEL